MKYDEAYPVGKTFKMSCDKGGSWFPMNDMGQVLNAAKWNMYRHKKLLRANFRYSNCRMYMETVVGHRDPGQDVADDEGFDLTRDIDKLSTVEIHWDFPHKYDVDLAKDQPEEVKSGLRPQRWMMSTWYKTILSRYNGFHYAYTPVYSGNLGRDGTSEVKDPQFGQPLDETYHFGDMSGLKFTDVLREMGCKAVHIDRVKPTKNTPTYHVKDTFWSPTVVMYVDPILPVSYCSRSATTVKEYYVYIKFDVVVYTRWKLYGMKSHVDDGVVGIQMSAMFE